MSMPTRDSIALAYREIQSRICSEIEKTDGTGLFQSDKWVREAGGGGLSRLMADGNVLEKAGVNYSAVHGPLNAQMMRNLNQKASDFFATGVSIVMHPNNPFVPIIHMNIRYFELDNGKYWFGGGIDLTPHYVIRDDARYFHSEVKGICDRYDGGYYPKFKKWADDYFYIPHREETRGVGGIFYDQLTGDEMHSKEELLNFSLDLGRLFPKVYSHLIHKHKNEHFTQVEREWQLLRRGRYVEFNLVYDRGTKFGLESNGRTESILMSLPKDARWIYNFNPDEGSPEAETISLLRKGIDWVGK